jgi:hypothetical protein
MEPRPEFIWRGVGGASGGVTSFGLCVGDAHFDFARS